MSMNEAIKILMVKRGDITAAKLAGLIGYSPQRFGDKMKRESFTDEELEKIASAVGCKYKAMKVFTIPETGEEIAI
jgi:hypothetical protein